MKNVLKQLGKAVCYLLLFFLMQLILTMIYTMIYSVTLSVQMGAQTMQMDPVALTQMITDHILQQAVTLALIADVLCVLFLWLFFAIRKKKLFEEANMNTVDKSVLPTVIGVAAGITLFVNGVLNLLPEAVLENYAEASGMLFMETTLLSVLAEALIVPIAEEIIFRGLILSRLRRAMPVWVAIVLSSLAFGLVHGQALWAAYAFALGCVLAIVAVKTDSILSSIMVHVVFNTFGVALSAMGLEVSVALCISMVAVGAALLAFFGVKLMRLEPVAVESSVGDVFVEATEEEATVEEATETFEE